MNQCPELDSSFLFPSLFFFRLFLCVHDMTTYFFTVIRNEIFRALKKSHSALLKEKEEKVRWNDDKL